MINLLFSIRVQEFGGNEEREKNRGEGCVKRMKMRHESEVSRAR